MEERLSSQPELNQRRPSKIPRKPVGGQSKSVARGCLIPEQKTSIEAPIPIEYVPYRSPVEDTPPAAFQYLPYRSPTVDALMSMQHMPYRSPTEALASSAQYAAYRRPSVARSSVSRGLSVSSFPIESGDGIMSNDGISPISPISAQSYFRRPSVQSFDDVISAISREVSQYRANDTAPRIPLSPLMELSAQEAVFRSSISIASPVGSVVRSRAATLASSGNQASERRNIPRSYSSSETDCSWLPVPLRWQFLLSVFILSNGLAALVLALMIKSQKHHGLGQVQDFAAFIFAWRYTPTLIAVIYVSFTMAIIKGIKQTEPLARLSRPDGASATSSLFLQSRLSWLDPFNAYSRRKNGGFRNWALFWATILNILALLVITPFSSALLSPREADIADSSDQARRIKQRLVGESILAAVQKLGTRQIATVNGQMAVAGRRIVVSVPVGIVLVVALLLSSLLLGLVAGYTRLHERPLNLFQSPFSAQAIASLISSGQNTRPLFEGLDISPEALMRKQLNKHVFYLRHGIIYSYDVRDAYQQSSSGRFHPLFELLRY